MRIAICIQNKELRSQLRFLLDGYGAQNGISLNCRFLENDIELLYDFIGGEYDAIFLDLFQNMADLIAEIRHKDKQVRLIPIAAVSQWMAEDYEKELWYCLPAPVSETFLFAVLDRLSSDLNHHTDAGIVIKCQKGIVYLAFSDLEYVEVINKTVCFHLLGGRTEEITSSLGEYEARLLHWPDFVKVHRSYIVNLRYIQKLEAGNILTCGGHAIPVSRRLFPQLKQNYLCRLMDPKVEQKNDMEEDSLPPPSPLPSSNNGQYCILLVDDEEEQRVRWSKVLIDKGCMVATAQCGETALQLAGEQRFDCVVLDVKLGQQSGFDLCSALGERTGAPVVFLSSLTDSDSQMQGFLSGGIDYVTKDTTGELFWLKIETRIKMAQVVKSEICNHNLRLELKDRKVFLQKHMVSLTTVEFDLLCLLMQNPGTVYSPSRLYGMVWGAQQWDDGQTVQLHLSQLRRKLESIYPQHNFIETVWGKGYCFIPEE